MHSRNLLDCLCSVVLSFQQILGWMKSPVNTRTSECENAHRGPHVLPGLAAAADPTTMSPLPALPLILTHRLFVGSSFPPRPCSTHSSWSLAQRVTSSPHLSCLSFHSNTPVTAATPGHKITALQVCARPCLPLFIPRAMGTCTGAAKSGPQ